MTLLNDNYQYKNKYNFTEKNNFLHKINNIPDELKNQPTWFYGMLPHLQKATNKQLKDPKYKDLLITLKDEPFIKYIKNKGKNPVNVNGVNVGHTDKTKFENFNTVINFNPLSLYHSFHLNNNYVCIDIDGAFGDDGKLYNWAKIVLDPFMDEECYIEKSLSGKGLHIIYKISDEIIDICKKNDIKDQISIQINKTGHNFCALPDKCKLEMFFNRPIILTGDIYENKNTEFLSLANSNVVDKLKGLIALNNNKYYEKAEKHIAKHKNLKLDKNNLSSVKNINSLSSNDNNLDNIFDYIKYTLDLKTVFEIYDIEVSNKNILCPLPYHNESNPSFFANHLYNLWYCHSCKKGGTVIDFIMEMDGIDNLFEAAQAINNTFKLGIEFNKQIDNPDKIKVKWDSNFVNVQYKDHEDKKINCTLSEYNETYDFDDENKPKFEKFQILQVKENVSRLLKHYSYNAKFNIIKDKNEMFYKDKKINLDFKTILIDIEDMAVKQNFKITKVRLEDLTKRIAINNKYNPIEDYLKEARLYYLEKPNNKIFDELASTIISDSKYKDTFIAKFLLQMVWLICSDDNSDIAGQYMLVLQGKQGLGKTTWFKKLLPDKFRTNYFLGGRLLDPSNKDHVIETVDNWLVEMGEIASTFRKTDQENLKNFITAHQDKYRCPYKEEAVTKKRRTSLCGNTNDLEYLRDLTGNRRFLTIPCQSIDWKKLNSLDKDMLWGFFYDLYLEGKPYAFTNEEEQKIIEYNEQYLCKPESLMMLEEKFILNPEIDEGDCWMSADQIYNLLDDKFIIPSKFKLGRELKRFGVNSKKTSRNTLYNIRLK